jgi:hypothetical protein
MKTRLKAMVFGGLIAGFLSAAPVEAWEWPWHNRDQRADNRSDRQSDHRSDNHGWNNGGGSGRDYEQLKQAREKTLYDASHHASRKQIAEDAAIADELENRMRHRR